MEKSILLTGTCQHKTFEFLKEAFKNDKINIHNKASFNTYDFKLDDFIQFHHSIRKNLNAIIFINNINTRFDTFVYDFDILTKVTSPEDLNDKMMLFFTQSEIYSRNLSQVREDAILCLNVMFEYLGKKSKEEKRQFVNERVYLLEEASFPLIRKKTLRLIGLEIESIQDFSSNHDGENNNNFKKHKATEQVWVFLKLFK